MMKTFYIIKSVFPFMFLPIAPGVVQVELQRQGLIANGHGTLTAVILQILLTLGIILWVAYTVNRKIEDKEYLKMSCVSKKVYHREQWMSVEKYLAEHHNIVVSHGMTPEESDEWLRDARAWVAHQAAQDAEEAGELAGNFTVALK